MSERKNTIHSRTFKQKCQPTPIIDFGMFAVSYLIRDNCFATTFVHLSTYTNTHSSFIGIVHCAQTIGMNTFTHQIFMRACSCVGSFQLNVPYTFQITICTNEIQTERRMNATPFRLNSFSVNCSEMCERQSSLR